MSIEKPKSLPLVGMIEIAMMAGVQRPAVSMWRLRHDDFPEPVTIEIYEGLNIGDLFWRPEVEEWLLATGRRVDARWSKEDVQSSEKRESRRFPSSR